jgi:hypothetical protein
MTQSPESLETLVLANPHNQNNKKDPYMKTYKPLLLSLVVALVAAPVIYAANVHFKKAPTFTDLGTTLRTCVSLTGLGNQDVTITIEAEGFANVTCTNPGGNVAPGQNRVPVREFGVATVPSTQIKNGNLTYCVTTDPAAAPSAIEAGCPNGNWTTTINNVDFTKATITVEQGGVVVLQRMIDLPPMN